VQDCRIGHADVQSLAALDEWQYAVLREQLFIDEADGIDVDRDGVEIEKRHAEFLRRGDGDVAGTRHPVRNEPAHEMRFTLSRIRDRIEHGGFLDEAIEHEPLGQPGQDGAHGTRCHGVIVQRIAPCTGDIAP
jgi:hypothetical protein